MEGLGFLNDKLEIKLLILFILRRIPGAVSRDLLTELMQADGRISYFDFSDCLYELIDQKLVTESEDGYTVTQRGAEAGETVESRLPYSVRKRAEKLLAPEAERQRRLSMITAKHEKTDGGCFVTLAMSDGEGEIIRLRLLCSGDEQAQRMEKCFKQNAETIYHGMIEMLDK